MASRTTSEDEVNYANWLGRCYLATVNNALLCGADAHTAVLSGAKVLEIMANR